MQSYTQMVKQAALHKQNIRKVASLVGQMRKQAGVGDWFKRLLQIIKGWFKDSPDVAYAKNRAAVQSKAVGLDDKTAKQYSKLLVKAVKKLGLVDFRAKIADKTTQAIFGVDGDWIAKSTMRGHLSNAGRLNQAKFHGKDSTRQQQLLNQSREPAMLFLKKYKKNKSSEQLEKQLLDAQKLMVDNQTKPSWQNQITGNSTSIA